MLQRVRAGRGDIGVVLQVVDIVQAVGGDQRGRRERLAPFLAAELEVVPQRIDARRLHVRVGVEIRARVERGEGMRPFAASPSGRMRERIDARRALTSGLVAGRSTCRKTRSGRDPRANRPTGSALRHRDARSTRRDSGNSRTGRRPGRCRHCFDRPSLKTYPRSRSARVARWSVDHHRVARVITVASTRRNPNVMVSMPSSASIPLGRGGCGEIVVARGPARQCREHHVIAGAALIS